MQIEQLETGKARGTQGGFDIRLITKSLQAAGGVEELFSHISHSFFRQGFPKYFQILGFQYARIFLYLLEVRIDTPLADLVADSRHILSDDTGKVIIRSWGFPVDNTPETCSPSLDTRIRGIPVIGIPDIGPSASAGINATGVLTFPIIDQAGQISHLISSSRFIPIHHHAERRVVAICFQDTVAFLLQPLILRFAATDLRPGPTFHLQIDSHTVRHMESGFRRTPGMEADMVQAIFLTGTVDLCPIVRLHGGIACQRENTAFQRAPEEDGLSVDFKTGSVRLELTEAE